MGKTPKIQFETFSDGLVDFYQLDDNRTPVKVLDGIRYKSRTVGYKRNYTAEQAGHNIEMLIRIPRCDTIARNMFAVIQGKQYPIVQAQTITDTIPQCTDLTLSQSDLLLDFQTSVSGSGGRF